MAKKSKVQIDVEVKGKGFKKVSLESNKAGEGLDKAAASASNYQKKEKGVAGASSNSTKNFSKMTTGITSGLVPAYATLAANIFAISAAFNFLKSAGDLVTLQASQQLFAQKTGQSLALLTSRVQEATKGLLSFEEAAQAVSIGRAAGLSADQIERLGSIALGASQALGRDLTDSFNRLTRGAIKAEPELLDELGIIVRLDRATRDYAQAVGKTAGELTAWERSQAVVNSVITQGEEKFDDLAISVNQFSKLGKEFDDLLNSIKVSLYGVSSIIAGGLANNVAALAGAFSLMGTSILKGLLPAPKALKSIADASKIAQANLAKMVTGGATGTNVGAGNIGTREIAAIKRAAAAQKTTILDLENFKRKEILKTLKIVEAAQQASLANQTTGIKAWKARWLANLYDLQARHGVIMGTMSAAAQSAGRAITTALTFVGWLGLALSLYGVIKEIIKAFDDDAVKELEDRMYNLKNSYEEQAKEIKSLSDNLKEVNSLQEKQVQISNLLTNINLKNADAIKLTTNNLEDFSVNEQMKATKDLQKANEPYMEGLRATIDLLSAQSGALEKAGADNSELAKIVQNLEGSYETLTGRIGNQTEDFVNYRNAVAYVNTALVESAGLVDVNKKENQQFLQGVQRVTRGLEQYQQGIGNTTQKLTPMGTALRGLEDIIGGVETILTKLDNTSVSSLEEIFDAATIANIESVLSPTVWDALNASLMESGGSAKDFAERVKGALVSFKALAKERDEYNRNETARQNITSFNQMAGATALLKEQLSVQNQLALAQIEIQKIQNSRLDRAVTLKNMSDEEIQAEDLKLQLLQAQTAEYENQLNSSTQIYRAANQALESGLQTSIAALIKGEESSIKDAMLGIAKGMLNAIADTMAKQLTQKIMGIGPLQTAAKQAKIIGSGIIQATQSGARILGNGIRAAIGTPGMPGGTLGVGGTDPLGAVTSSIGIPFGGTAGTGILGGVSKAFNFAKSIFGFANGGIAMGGITPYATGGVVKRPTLGLVGEGKYNEAVVPLPDGKSIPVKMGGMGQNNNVTVNVAIDGQGRASSNTQQDSAQAGNLGNIIAKAVQQELQNQKRSGGILNPYGVA